MHTVSITPVVLPHKIFLNEDIDMTYKVDPSPTPAASVFSQVMFVTVGLAIIVGGSWSLYMSDAPYHPVEDTVYAIPD